MFIMVILLFIDLLYCIRHWTKDIHIVYLIYFTHHIYRVDIMGFVSLCSIEEETEASWYEGTCLKPHHWYLIQAELHPRKSDPLVQTSDHGLTHIAKNGTLCKKKKESEIINIHGDLISYKTSTQFSQMASSITSVLLFFKMTCGDCLWVSLKPNSQDLMKHSIICLYNFVSNM